MYFSHLQGRCFIPALLILFFLFLPVSSNGQDSEDIAVHWAYSAFLGTGWYKLDGNREVFVLRVPPRWYFRESSISDSGQRQLGIEFHFPLTFGMHKLDEFEDFIDFDNIGTVSFNPGVEIEYPVTERWRLRAYGHLGWGTEIETSDTAWIFDVGVKSRYSFRNGNLDWGLVNEVFYAGFDEKDQGSDSLGGFMAGFDFSYPISLRSGTGEALQLNWDITYTWLDNDLSFTRTSEISNSVKDEWQIGVAFARRNGPIKIWFLEFQQMGLAYRFNSEGDFRAITFKIRAPFTR